MRRLVGVVPVAVLGLAIAISTWVGLRLSEDTSTQTVADELGCEYVSSSHPQAGVTQETCRYHGDTVVILSLDRGAHLLQDPAVPDNVVLFPDGKPVVVGCPSRDDCVQIHRQLGGNLSSGPLLGISLVVE